MYGYYCKKCGKWEWSTPYQHEAFEGLCRECYEKAKEKMPKGKMPKGHNYSVGIMNERHTDYKIVYSGIDDLRDANLLAQLLMSKHIDGYDGLVFIFPGWNLGIKSYPNEYAKALKLAEKYKEDE